MITVKNKTAAPSSRPSRSGDLVRFKRILRRHLPEFRARYKVKSFALFGSYVRGDHRKRSDLDVLVEFDEGSLSLLDFVGLENHLSDLLGVKVDLVDKFGLKPGIGRHVLQELLPV